MCEVRIQVDTEMSARYRHIYDHHAVLLQNGPDQGVTNSMPSSKSVSDRRGLVRRQVEGGVHKNRAPEGTSSNIRSSPFQSPRNFPRSTWGQKRCILRSYSSSATCQM
jgi:hypothetical protein